MRRPIPDLAPARRHPAARAGAVRLELAGRARSYGYHCTKRDARGSYHLT
jgi:hypothetical protein